MLGGALSERNPGAQGRIRRLRCADQGLLEVDRPRRCGATRRRCPAPTRPCRSSKARSSSAPTRRRCSARAACTSTSTRRSRLRCIRSADRSRPPARRRSRTRRPGCARGTGPGSSAPRCLGQPGHAGAQRADAADQQLDRHALLRGEVERVDHRLVDERVGLDPDPRRPPGSVVLDLAWIWSSSPLRTESGATSSCSYAALRE